MPIKNLIIDLGAVLYEIDIPAAVHSFAQLLGGKPEHLQIIQGHMHHNPIWKEYEKGVISSAAFRQGIRESLEIEVADEAIDQAWNSLLIGPIAGRGKLLQELGQRYRMVLLSNTNEIHFLHLAPHSQEILTPFEKLYLSFEMKARKPDAEIYEQVLQSEGFDPTQSLFIDDSAANISGALSVGLQAIQVESDGAISFYDLFADLTQTDQPFSGQ